MYCVMIPWGMSLNLNPVFSGSQALAAPLVLETSLYLRDLVFYHLNLKSVLNFQKEAQEDRDMDLEGWRLVF